MNEERKKNDNIKIGTETLKDEGGSVNNETGLNDEKNKEQRKKEKEDTVYEAIYGDDMRTTYNLERWNDDWAKEERRRSL